MTVLITLTIAGLDVGPFNLYSNVDGFTSAFESGVTRLSLISGYTSTVVPDGTVTIRVVSTNPKCTNYIDIPLMPGFCNCITFTSGNSLSANYTYTQCSTGKQVNGTIPAFGIVQVCGSNPTVDREGIDITLSGACTTDGECVIATTTTTTTGGLVQNGWVFFSDMNWLVSVNDPDNILACQKLFENFFGGVKDLACARYVNNLYPVLEERSDVFGVYYPGASSDTSYLQNQFCPVLHAALDPLGYTFTGYDITQPGAGATINKPFVMHLYSYNDYTSVFTPTVIANLQQIAANHPVIVFGEWRRWDTYDDYIIQNVMGYLSSELRYSTNNDEAYGIPNSANLLGQALIDSGVTKFVYSCTGEFTGTLAEQFAFAKTDNTNQPSMLAIPYRPDFL